MSAAGAAGGRRLGGSRVTEQVARIYLDEAFADGFESADVLLLGCTHYPLLKPLLRRLVPAHVTIVDSADSTARVVSQLLRQGLPKRSAEEERRGQASAEILRDRFSGKIPPPGCAISGKPDRGCRARGAEENRDINHEGH